MGVRFSVATAAGESLAIYDRKKRRLWFYNEDGKGGLRPLYDDPDHVYTDENWDFWLSHTDHHLVLER